ncbi:MAG TPA: hypothetical protein VF898_13410 [Chloroflexota bacterium]
MTLRALIDVTTQLMTSGDFRNLLVNDADHALSTFDLTEEEKTAIKSRDRWQLEACGLEEWTARWVSALR